MAFCHNNLPGADTYIRLLRVRSVDETRPVPVHCELSTWPMTQAPGYNAISYTWGDLSAVKTILVNKKPMQVRQNCEYVLRQASWYAGRNTYYWCDAICIDQGNHHEKNCQVAAMGAIYANARLVLACVGEHEEDSEYLYKQLQRGTSFDPSEHPEQQLSRIRIWIMRHLANMPRLYQALAAFLRRPYFARVWVFQELSLGHYVHVCCGSTVVPILRLYQMAIGLAYMRECGLLPLLATPLLPAVAVRTLNRYCSDAINYPSFVCDNYPSLTKAMPLLVAGAFQEVRFNMKSAVFHVAHLLCQDPRDTIYGILALIDWGGRQPLVADYAKCRYALAMDAMAHIRASADTNHVWDPFEAAITLANNLRLLHDPPARLLEATRARCITLRLCPSSHNHHYKNTTKGYSPWVLPNYRAYRLKKIGTKWWFYEDSRSRRITVGDAFTIAHWLDDTPAVLAHLRKNWILLPPVAKPGDYCLVCADVQPHNRSKSIVFVATRGQDPNHLRIIGKGLMHAGEQPARLDASWAYEDARVYMNVEDLLVLVSTLDWSCDLSQNEPGQIANFLESQVDASAGSSWAVLRQRKRAVAAEVPSPRITGLGSFRARDRTADMEQQGELNNQRIRRQEEPAKSFEQFLYEMGSQQGSQVNDRPREQRDRILPRHQDLAQESKPVTLDDWSEDCGFVDFEFPIIKITAD